MGKPARMLQHPVLAHKNGQKGDTQDSLTLNDDVSIGMTCTPVGFHIALLQRLFNEQSKLSRINAQKLNTCTHIISVIYKICY